MVKKLILKYKFTIIFFLVFAFLIIYLFGKSEFSTAYGLVPQMNVSGLIFLLLTLPGLIISIPIMILIQFGIIDFLNIYDIRPFLRVLIILISASFYAFIGYLIDEKVRKSPTNKL